jgi:hypothetical protein
MAILLRIVGGALLFFGLGNIIGAPWGMNADGLTASQRLFNGGVLALPGMVLFVVADVVQKKTQSIS